MDQEHPQPPPNNPAASPSVAGSGPQPPSSGNDAVDTPPVSRRRWIAAALGALAVVLFAVPLLRGPATGPGGGDDGQGAQVASANGTCAAREGTANFDFTMKDPEGRDVRLSDYRGKVVLLNFWATWCGPCKVEIPEFVEVYKQYRDRGFEILGVLSQDDPSRDDLQAFASAYQMNYPLFRANEEFENAHGPIWALPTTYIIDRQGTICTKHMGPVSKETVEREIKGLL